MTDTAEGIDREAESISLNFIKVNDEDKLQ